MLKGIHGGDGLAVEGVLLSIGAAAAQRASKAQPPAKELSSGPRAAAVFHTAVHVGMNVRVQHYCVLFPLVGPGVCVFSRLCLFVCSFVRSFFFVFVFFKKKNLRLCFPPSSLRPQRAI